MQSELVADVPRFSLTERDRRWAHVRELMRQERLDAIFVPPNTGLWDQFQSNVRYLTGIGGNCAQAAAIIPLEGDVTAVTNPDVDARYWHAPGLGRRRPPSVLGVGVRRGSNRPHARTELG